MLYVRVSTDDQARNGVSLNAQEERLRAYCTAVGLEIVTLLREEGVSAAKPLAKRPQGTELLRLTASWQVRHVVAFKLDRLFRDAVDALDRSREWDKQGVALHLLDMGGQAIDTSSAMGRMFLTMAAGFAELERNAISERTRSALAHKRDHLQVYGNTPFGFRRAGDRLIPHEGELATVCRIYGLHGEGLSTRQIAEELGAAGVRTKTGRKVWTKQSVWWILSNQALYDRHLAKLGTGVGA